jgi:hypothetical protein
MKFEIPEPMKIEHEMVQATKAGGKTGEAVKRRKPLPRSCIRIF